MINIRDIQIRDPFVYCDRIAGKYYMYGTTDTNCWSGPGVGFDGYGSIFPIRFISEADMRCFF
jgi:hypothetical protein